MSVFTNLYRPKGPLDDKASIEGVTLETLVLQEIMAQNSYKSWDYEITYWRTERHQNEVDFVLYNSKSFFAIEVKNSIKLKDKDFKSLLVFCEDYPEAKAIILYRGKKMYSRKNIRVIPVENFLKSMDQFL